MGGWILTTCLLGATFAIPPLCATAVYVLSTSENTTKWVPFSICVSILWFNGSWLHHQPTLPVAVQQHSEMQTAQHQPSLPMPAQTAQPRVGEQPNLPQQPQHPANPSQPMQPQQLGNPHLWPGTPWTSHPRLLLDMPLEAR
uniref:Amelogenin n=1 Tax=Calidris pygmaea TaxID=425635 RepID=A0A8C3KJ27_9CHAR